MNVRLRLVVGLAVAQILATGVLVALRDASMPSIQVYALGGQLLEMPAPIFAVAVGFFVLALAYLMAGALHSHALIRLGAVAAFLGGLYLELDTIRGYGGWVTITLIALGPAMVVVGAYTWLYDRHHRRRGSARHTHTFNLHIPTMLAVLAIFGILYGLPFLDPGINRLLLSIHFTTQLFVLSFFLIPMLLLGGADFAEWGDTAGTWVGEGLKRLRLAFLPMALAAAIAIAVLVVHVNSYRRTVIYEVVLGLGAVAFLVFVAWLTKLWRTPWSPHVPLWTLVLTVVLSFGVLSAYFIIPAAANAQQQIDKARQSHSTVPELSTYSRVSVPSFSIQRPMLWEFTADQDTGPGKLTLLHFDGLKVSNPALMFVAAIPASADSEQSALAGLLLALTGPNGPFPGMTAYVTADRSVGDYMVTDLGLDPPRDKPSAASFRATSWTRTSGDQVWVMLGVTTERLYDFNRPTFEAMATSWKGEATAAATGGGGEAAPATHALADADTDHGLLLQGAVWGAAGVLAVAALALFRGRRLTGLLTAGLFVAVGAVLFAFNLPVQIGAILFRVDWSAWQGLRLSGVQETVAVLTLAWLLWVVVSAQRRREYVRPTLLLLGLNIALQCMAWIYELYAQSLSVDRRLTVLQAVIFVLALVWDVLMSGESLTNRHSSTVPRHSRVLMYFGYVMLVAATILFFSSLHAQGSGAIIQPQFESDFWPQSGLGLFGTPLVVTLFLVRLAAWAGGRQASTAARAPG